MSNLTQVKCSITVKKTIQPNIRISNIKDIDRFAFAQRLMWDYEDNYFGERRDLMEITVEGETFSIEDLRANRRNPGNKG